MSERRDALDALEELSRKKLDTDEMFKLIWEFEHDAATAKQDRAAAVSIAGILEQLLANAITTHFAGKNKATEHKNLFDGEGAISSDFGARIQLGYALGIYGPLMRSDLTTIRIVRNAFAHTTEHLTFDSPKVANVCGFLNLPKRDVWDGLDERPTTPPLQYIKTAKVFYLMLDVTPNTPPLRYLEREHPELFA